ncbi:EAL domain-containing protein [Aristophania vespae]|uniref:EAL domain-containing protein n=1 Tax=Aristophania vespae TaxID=2697033 RepID=A0A6P1NBV2_9PROT|nr:EAL domain-containing protein [Aristophania vespae]QHI96155.1 EAL domain-containing protein [Aristophania vespae]
MKAAGKDHERLYRTSDNLGNVLTQYRGFGPFLVSMFKNIYKINPVDPAISTIKAHILHSFAPIFAVLQLIVAFCLTFFLWDVSGSVASISLIFTAILIIALSAYFFFVKEQHLMRAPAIYVLRLFALCLGIFWVTILVTIFPKESDIGQLIACLLVMALMASAVLFLPVAGASALFSAVVGLGTCAVILYDWAKFHHETLYLLGAIIFFIYTCIVVLSCALIRELLIGYLIKRYYLEQRNAILTLLLGDTSDIAGDWLWETDDEGALTGVSPSFKHALNVQEDVLYEQPFVEIMLQKASQNKGKSFFEDMERLKECLEQRLFFRDLIVEVQKENETRYWSLSGRPLFQDQKFVGYRGVGTDVTHIHNIHRKASFRARHDEMTNLPNRTAFFDDMEFYLVEAEQSQEVFALLNIDLDGFKSVNDQYGHHAGDYVLSQIAITLNKILGEGDTLYRIGGDEFVLINKKTSKEKANLIAQDLIKAITSKPITIKEGASWTPGVSIGIVLTKGGMETVTDLLAASDLALYEGKKRGGNCAVFFDSELETLAQRKLSLLRDLSLALDEGEISLRYQPFYDAQTQKLRGFEALLCWKHSLYGRILTEQIITIAEESGLIQKLGLFVLAKATEFAASWPEHLILSINLSPGQILRKDFINEWLIVLDGTKFPPHRLQIEVTETIFMKQSAATFAKLHKLRDRGMAIALDDFGKGFSCLGYLYFFPFSKIKLDRLFIRDMLRDQRAATIVKGIVNLAVDLSISLTVEGVESREQYDYIVGLGCSEVQGFFFAGPLPPKTVIQLISKSGEIVQ